jgi:hypothetical protein
LKYFKILSPVQVSEDLKDLLNQVCDQFQDRTDLLQENENPYEYYNETSMSVSQTIKIPQIAELANMPDDIRQLILLVILENQYFIKNYKYEVIAAVINSLTRDSLPLSAEGFIEHYDHSWKQAFPVVGKPKSVWLFHYDCRFWLLMLRIIVRSLELEPPENAKRLSLIALEKVLEFKNKFKGYGHYPEVSPLICILIKLGPEEVIEKIKDYCKNKLSKVHRQIELIQGFSGKTDELICLFLQAQDNAPSEKWVKQWQEVLGNTDQYKVKDFCNQLWKAYLPSEEEVKKLAHLSGGTLDMEVILAIQRQLYQDFQDITEYEEFGRNITRSAIWSYGYIDAAGTVEELEEFCKKYYQFKDFCKAAIFALENIETEESLKLLQLLQHMVKDREIKLNIYSALSKLGAKQGLSVEVLKDLTTDDCGLDVNGIHSWILGRDFLVNLKLKDNAEIELEYIDKTTSETCDKPPKMLKEKYEKEYNSIQDIHDLLIETYSLQKARLEEAMCQQRSWNIKLWKDIFEDNSVNLNIARRLTWALYDQNNTFKSYFFMLEPGNYCDIDQQPLNIEETDNLKIVHPVLMRSEEIEKARQLFESRNFEQPFQQLTRKIYRLHDNESGEVFISKRFNGLKIPFNLFQENMKQLGWTGFGATDFEDYNNKYKDFQRLLWRAYIDIDMTGINIWTITSDITLGDIYFCRLAKRGKHFKPEPKEQHVRLKEVDPIVFSEALSDISMAISSKVKI